MTFSLLPATTPAQSDGAAETVKVPVVRSREPVPSEFVWVGEGVLPNDAEIHRAVEVLSAVPLAGAVGWSVRGHPWSCHPRRLRTAVVPPSEHWDITQMRGVREVDSLSGRLLVRRAHLGRLPADYLARDGETDPVARSMRAAGFRLLFLGRADDAAVSPLAG